MAAGQPCDLSCVMPSPPPLPVWKREKRTCTSSEHAHTSHCLLCSVHDGPLGLDRRGAGQPLSADPAGAAALSTLCVGKGTSASLTVWDVFTWMDVVCAFSSTTLSSYHKSPPSEGTGGLETTVFYLLWWISFHAASQNNALYFCDWG